MHISRIYRPDTERQIAALVLLLRSAIPDSQMGSKGESPSNTTVDRGDLATPDPSSDHRNGGRRNPAGCATEARR